MDNRRYQVLRTSSMEKLGEYMNLPGYEAAMQHAVKQASGGIGRIMREEYLARTLFQCHDLTAPERAAAYLLAVISNHRAITWKREPSPPSGHEQLPPLEQGEAHELAKVTRDAVREFSAFLPESERAVLLDYCWDVPEAALEAAPAAAKVRTNQQPWGDTRLRELLEESNQPGATNTSLGKKHGVTRQRIGILLNTAKEKFRPGNRSQYSQLMAPTRINKGRKY